MDFVSDARTMFTIFGIGYLALSLIMAALNRHALKKRQQLLLNETEVFDIKTELQHWLIQASLPAVSIVIAQLAPIRFVVLAGICYALLGVLVPWHYGKRLESPGGAVVREK